MAKYAPLTAFLAASRTDEVRMTFAEIEGVLGGSLPASKAHAAWWSNNAANNVMTRAWLAAGFRTERVDTVNGRLVFRRSPVAPGSKPVAGRGRGPGLVKRIQAKLGGTVTLPAGLDLTAPGGGDTP